MNAWRMFRKGMKYQTKQDDYIVLPAELQPKGQESVSCGSEYIPPSDSGLTGVIPIPSDPVPDPE